MQQPTDIKNADQTFKLMDFVQTDGSQSLGSVMLRLAEMAAAQHRANAQPNRVKPWADLESIELSLQDTPGHASPAKTRIARDLGTVATEGDR